MALRPPKHVPGPFRPPGTPPGIPTQHLPRIRYHTVAGGETLASLAENYYGNPREATRIFNANRADVFRADRTYGFLLSLNDSLPTGGTLLIP